MRPAKKRKKKKEKEKEKRAGSGPNASRAVRSGVGEGSWRYLELCGESSYYSIIVIVTMAMAWHGMESLEYHDHDLNPIEFVSRESPRMRSSIMWRIHRVTPLRGPNIRIPCGELLCSMCCVYRVLSLYPRLDTPLELVRVSPDFSKVPHYQPRHITVDPDLPQGSALPTFWKFFCSVPYK